MDIADFLPKYPNIVPSSQAVLNPYRDDFYSAIYRKKEFYENRLERSEVFPRERGLLTKYQKTIVRFMSSHTPYDRLLLVHSMGLGKTCSAIGAIEQIKMENNGIDGAIILTKGQKMRENFVRELAEKCTPGYYIPENYQELTKQERVHRIRKKISYYQFGTYIKFAKKLQKTSDADIIASYSNKIIVLDEVHNLRIQPGKDEKQALETYNQYHRLLHLVKNCKILFLSGTPMKDSPAEIASIMNLLLPLDNQLPTGEEFLQRYMTEQGGVYQLKPKRIQELKNKFRGLISFLREAESMVERQYIGQPGYGQLNHLIVDPIGMSKFQTDGYRNAYIKDTQEQSGIYNNSREATLFVYPDGSYGHTGFSKYIKETQKSNRFILSGELRKAVEGNNKKEILKRIERFSCTYAKILNYIDKADGNCFIYCSIVHGSGAILFSLLLEMLGYKRATGQEKEPGLRYALLTGSEGIRDINDRFNRPDNMKGQIIKVIIGSKAISEGYSFKNVIFEAILTPHWNYSETAQALARGIRLGSHNDLIMAGEKPLVEIIQPAAIPADDELPSVDLLQYKTSEDKDISIKSVLRMLMETAFDCALNYMRNYNPGQDGSRECDYTTCAYTCDGVNMTAIQEGLEESDLDYSTYQLYYANPMIPLIRQKIERMFRDNAKLTLDAIISNLKNQFNEEEIKNALFTIQEESESGEFDYKTFLALYSRSPVKQIMNKVEELFKTFFRLDLKTILAECNEYTPFEVVTALSKIITDNIALKNKYGLNSYLREENNIYFLVSNLIVDAEAYLEYYNRQPHVLGGISAENIQNAIYVRSLPKIIRKIFSVDNEKDFTALIKPLPLPIKEMLIENSIVAEEKGLDKNVDARQRIIEFFKGYLKKIEQEWVLTLDPNRLRCKEAEQDWRDCPPNYQNKLDRLQIERETKMRQSNPYGIMGKYNPESKKFCLIDFFKEKKSREKMISKKGQEGKPDDLRAMYSGKVCETGWRIPELLDLIVNRLKIDPPDDYDPGNKAQIRANLALLAKDKIPGLDKADGETIRRALYWGLPANKGGRRGVKQLCQVIEDWLKQNDLYQIDTQCGVQGKRKAGTVQKGPKKTAERQFRIETIVPRAEEEKFRSYGKEIDNLMTQCFGQKGDRNIDDSMWLLVFSRKKIVGMLMVDNKNRLWNVCVAKNYRRQNIAKQAMAQATQYVCNVRGQTPSLLVRRSDPNAKKLIRMYESFGFSITQETEELTTMMHGCKN